MNTRYGLMLAVYFLFFVTAIPGVAAGGGSLCDGDWCYPCPPMVVPEGVIFITPGGNGPSLAAQGMILEVEMVECNGEIPPTVPGDITLQPPDGTVQFCGPVVADSPLDAEGRTQFSGVLAGGGSLLADGDHQLWTHVYLFGTYTTVSGDVSFVSPDLNGDLRVDLGDVAMFGMLFIEPGYDFRADLNRDGNIDFADIANLAIHFGERCD